MLTTDRLITKVQREEMESCIESALTNCGTENSSTAQTSLNRAQEILAEVAGQTPGSGTPEPE